MARTNPGEPCVVKADSRDSLNVGKEKAGGKYKPEFKENGVVALRPVGPSAKER